MMNKAPDVRSKSLQSHLPVGRIAENLEKLTREQAWATVLAASGLVLFLEWLFPGVGFTPLYIPIICAAAWCLGPSAGYIVAVSAAVLAARFSIALYGPPSASAFVGTLLVRAGTFSFVAATLTSFRRAFDRQHFLAQRDRMTGALNAECFREHVGSTLAAARSHGETLLLALLDLDDFKAVNTAYGHASGDEVIRAFSRAAVKIVRRNDYFGRLGGDEFALLLTLPSDGDAHDLADSLHQRLSVALAASSSPTTCSMGALIIPPAHDAREPDVIEQADRLMYVVKNRGKNAVEVAWYRDPTPEPPARSNAVTGPRDGHQAREAPMAG